MQTGASQRADAGPGPVGWRVWYDAARPKTLWASVAPVAIGSALALADGGFHAGVALACLAGALLIQIGTNFCNDYADFKKGADTAHRIGPVRATQAGLVSPQAMWRATVLVFGLAALVGAYLVVRGGWPLLVIALASIAAGIAYTAGPYALAYLGLGDVFVLVFFGPVAVGGTYYVQTLHWPASATVAGLAPGLISCALLAVNNLRDVEQDRSARKRTLAVRFGAAFVRWEYIGGLALAIVGVPLVLWVWYDLTPWVLLAGLSLWPAWKPLQRMWGGTAGRELNPVLGQTARVLLVYALFFTLGCIAGMFPT